jgi:hypothetical protein
MSVAPAKQSCTESTSSGITDRVLSYLAAVIAQAHAVLNGEVDLVGAAERVDATEPAETVRMRQMGAKRIGQLAIGLAVVGIVLNEMSQVNVVTNSSGVIDINSILNTAGSGLQLLVVGVIILAASILLSLFGGF